MDEEPSSDRGPDGAIVTEAEFRATLQRAVVEAASNGVDVDGRWSVERDGSERTWTVDITDSTAVSTLAVDDADSPVVSIVEGVAAREGVEPTDLPPLQESIDYGALERLLREGDGGEVVQFEYGSYDVTVQSDGAVRIEE